MQSWQQQLVSLEQKVSSIESAMEREQREGVAEGEGRGLTGGNMEKRKLK